ncbi:MAG: hypothetical protein EBZ48_17480, partial [Proteobacteria bacterium]|nr:hypothetical protein [Pseudomonadota bacterium]
ALTTPAEHEIRSTFNSIVESGLVYFWDRRRPEETPSSWVTPELPTQFYQAAFRSYEAKDSSRALHWARAAKALARAYWHEAKIAYFKSRVEDLPSLKQALNDEYHLHEKIDSARNLIEVNQRKREKIIASLPSALASQRSGESTQSVGTTPNPALPEESLGHWIEMIHLCALAQLEVLEKLIPSQLHELLHAEHLKCASEYGRCTQELLIVHEEIHQKKLPQSSEPAA